MSKVADRRLHGPRRPILSRSVAQAAAESGRRPGGMRQGLRGARGDGPAVMAASATAALSMIPG